MEEGTAPRFVSPTVPAQEVRRCARCNEVSVVVVRKWEGAVFSANDYRCQSCGATPAIRDLFLPILVGVLTLPALIGVVPLVIAFRRFRIRKMNPVVPGAVAPRIRFSAEDYPRRCKKCTGTAFPTRITRRRTNGIPSGIEYRYRCVACTTEFTTESWGGLTLNLLSFPLIVAVGLVAFSAGEHWAVRYLLGIGLVLVGLLMLGSTVGRIVAAVQNPLIEGSPSSGHPSHPEPL